MVISSMIDVNFFELKFILCVGKKDQLVSSKRLFFIKNINSVIGFLGDKSGTPVPMRQAEVNRILGKVDEMASQSEVININYMVGEQVKVMDGPFQGFSGVIEEVNDEKKKLKVMVKIFGRRTPLELNYMQVEKE